LTLASTNGPFAPLSTKTAYPVIGQPPLFNGSCQLIVIEVNDEDTLEGLAKPEGVLHGG
jgi:hypothetical protein